jgi:predicted MFS family arabinose efflux permease
MCPEPENSAEEDIVTFNHFATFGGIVHSFARLEWMMQTTMAAIAELDDDKIMILTKELSYRQKRSTLYSYMEMASTKDEWKTGIKALLDEADKYNDLRNNIAHANWRRGRRPKSIKPLTLVLRGGKGRVVGQSDQDRDYTEIELAAIADRVPRQHLQSAVALNSVGLNVSRAVGPALAGLIISALGIAAPFWVNALTTVAVITALIWWRPLKDGTEGHLPAERFIQAIGAGLRHARYNSHLRATLIRAGGFFVFASAYWALLPLVARDQIVGGAKLYGVLLGAIGAGAVVGAFALPWLKRRLGPDRTVALGTAGTIIALVLFALARHWTVALCGSLIAGGSWIAVLATINVSAQLALPGWVRGRGLSIFGTVMFGSLTIGSAIWGKVAELGGLPAAHILAGIGALIAVPLLWRWKLQTGADLDLTPSMHWPVPVLTNDVDADRGPVLVTVEYRIRPIDRGPFLAALQRLAGERRRDGAFEWEVFEDVSQEGWFMETFKLDSWVEHLRQHERVTHADREQQELVHRFQSAGEPNVTHFIAAF